MCNGCIARRHMKIKLEKINELKLFFKVFHTDCQRVTVWYKSSQLINLDEAKKKLNEFTLNFFIEIFLEVFRLEFIRSQVIDFQKELSAKK